MQLIESPKANPENLLEIIRDACSAKVVIPDFQRSFVWVKDDLEDLLASILQGYFIGTFLMLDTPSKNPMFPFEPVEGVKIQSSQHATVRLVLDGQQRITSLFYALYEPNISLRGSKYPYRFYLRLESVLERDFETAVVGVSERDGRRRANLEQLVQADKALPFSRLRDSSSFNKWLYREQSIWQEEELQHFERLHERLQKFMVPVISLSPEISEDDIVNIFERINRTGVSLSLFDLVVAKLYRQGIRLRELWKAVTEDYPAITSIVKPEFLLRLIALFQGQEPRKGNLLKMTGQLDAKTFQALWDDGLKALVQAHQRLTCVYGAFNPKWIPYTTLIVPLAALLHKIMKSSAGAEAYQKLDCWYWGSVLGQRYDNAVDTKTYQDFRDIGLWIENRGSAPDWLQRLSTQNLNLDVDEPYSTLYRGLMGLIACQGSRDFLTGQPAELNECQDDHIFSKSVYGQSYSVDTLLNRTLISKETNNTKGNKSPAKFLKECLKKHGNDEARLLETLQSHFISKDAYEALKQDDFKGFITERRRVIEKAVKELFLLAEPVDLESSVEGEANYWLTPVAPNEGQTPEQTIQILVGQEKIYAFGDKTPGRRHIKLEDWISFYASGKGVVAHAQVASIPERKPDPRIPNSEKYPWVFQLKNTQLYLEQPTVLDEAVRNKLEAFQGREPTSPWAWFVQATRKISAHDFGILTRSR